MAICTSVSELPKLNSKIIKIKLSKVDNLATLYFDDNTDIPVHIFRAGSGASKQLEQYKNEYNIKEYESCVMLVPKKSQ